MWRYIGNCADSEPFDINGLNVWNSTWERVGNEVAEVRDPLYNQLYRFEVYRVQQGTQFVEFAAGEFSNSVWGFYARAQ